MLSGRIGNLGEFAALNDELVRLGGTCQLTAQGDVLTFGDGSVLNPANTALLAAPDFDAGNGGDNVYSYSPSGNSFVVFSLMILLTVLAVGLLSLSSIELRRSSSANATDRARANARLGLLLALGELPQHCGPDQRITADAQDVAGNSTTPTHRHWLSVWRSTKEDGTPWIVRNAAKGGLEGLRQTSGWQAKDERIACLVSGNESRIQSIDDQAEDTAELIPLVAEGSLGDQAAANGEVRVPRVTIGPAAQPEGAYAWWVGDLGTLANVATNDATEATHNGQYHARMLAQDASWRVFGKAELTTTQRARLASEAQLKLADPEQKDRGFRNRITTNLMPVLAESSLYYNLSYYDPAKPVAANPYAMRVHFYPRVALWNPYNFALEVPASAIFLQINGSKSVEVTLQNGQQQRYRMYWGLGGSATGGAVRGSMFFKLDAATLAPGQTLVWSPAHNGLYDESNFANNLLTTTVAPSPGRGFYQDKRVDGYPLFQVQQGFPPKPGLANNLLPQIPLEWREVVPPKPAGDIQSAAYTQADDFLVSWKPMSGNSLSLTSFAALPMGRFVSCAYQYGDEDELPVEWTALDPVPFPKSSLANPAVTDLPDRRTRDGFRLRWFEEPESNVIGSGSLAGTPHLQDAAVGNWNLRASWSYRNPFDNVTDVAPHFFGIYTRDLFDGAVDWTSMTPQAAGGAALGDPFDQPVNGPAARILFDVPRQETAIASMGAFQHVNFSEFIWHPTYALGNSLADPRVPPTHTEPDRSESINADKGGWNQDSIGYATDGRSDNNGNNNRTNEDNWAYHPRNFLQQAALDQTLVYDLSYELNHTLWDAYFLSSGTEADKRAFLRDPARSPLPNGRVKPNPMAGPVTAADLTDFHRAAPHLRIDGAFNVNSTSAAAWEALLLSGLGQQTDADTTAWGALGFLTQADLLQFIGPVLTARSDTFRIRAYGECLDGAGKVTARAWCEAIVQRSPNHVDGADDSLALPETLNPTNRQFGRRFEIVNFRWLRQEEVGLGTHHPDNLGNAG